MLMLIIIIIILIVTLFFVWHLRRVDLFRADMFRTRAMQEDETMIREIEQLLAAKWEAESQNINLRREIELLLQKLEYQQALIQDYEL